ncbi:MAG: rod shape-determining protein MreD [Lachnospiraceae bacterium]
MKKYCVMLLTAAVVFLIQINVFPMIDLIRTTPNLLIIVIVGYGFLGGHIDGMLAGLLSGFLMDIVYGNVLGYYELPYMYIGFFSGFFRPYFNTDNFMVPSALCGVSDLIMGLYIFVTGFAVRNRLNLKFYFLKIILPEVVYTVIISLILFRVLVWLINISESRMKRRRRQTHG